MTNIIYVDYIGDMMIRDTKLTHEDINRVSNNDDCNIDDDITATVF